MQILVNLQLKKNASPQRSIGPSAHLNNLAPSCRDLRRMLLPRTPRSRHRKFFAHADVAMFRVSVSVAKAVSKGETFSIDSDGANFESPAASARFKGCRSFTVERITSHPTAKSGAICKCDCAMQRERAASVVTHVKVFVALKNTTIAKGLLPIASFHRLQNTCHPPHVLFAQFLCERCLCQAKYCARSRDCFDAAWANIASKKLQPH